MSYYHLCMTVWLVFEVGIIHQVKYYQKQLSIHVWLVLQEKTFESCATGRN